MLPAGVLIDTLGVRRVVSAGRAVMGLGAVIMAAAPAEGVLFAGRFVVNLGGFLGAALTQGPLGTVLDARWAGAMADGARVYPVEAYRVAFGACAALVLAAVLLTLLIEETRGANVYAELRSRAASRRMRA